MTSHWNEQRDALREWVIASPKILIGCDFDGTLAPLVPHAADARLPAATRTALQRLVALSGVTLAFISGRSLADLQRRIDLAGALYAGNHGLELTGPDGSTILAPGAVETMSALHGMQTELTAALAHIPGVWIEDKQLTLSVHYRLADHHHYAEVKHLVWSAVSLDASLLVRPGKCIWEIRPAIAWDKGTALRRFMKQCQVSATATAFIGDDVTDYDAFRELPEGWTFIVGDGSVLPARVSLRDPHDCAALLEWMAGVRTGVRHACGPSD